jgi:hypothetical protein
MRILASRECNQDRLDRLRELHGASEFSLGPSPVAKLDKASSIFGLGFHGADNHSIKLRIAEQTPRALASRI